MGHLLAALRQSVLHGAAFCSVFMDDDPVLLAIAFLFSQVRRLGSEWYALDLACAS
jgi:hypothetical protein